MSLAAQLSIPFKDFWRLAPFEFQIMLRGRTKLVRAEWTRTAQLASWLLHGLVGKDAPTADELLGQERVRVSEFSSYAEALKAAREKG